MPVTADEKIEGLDKDFSLVCVHHRYQKKSFLLSPVFIVYCQVGKKLLTT